MSKKRKTDTLLMRTLEDAMKVLIPAPESDYQWAAGFVEADGCISIGMSKENRAKRRESRYRYHILVTVTQKDPRPVRALRIMFGGVIDQVKRNKIFKYNRWTVCANRAYATLVLLEPFLRIKREQAQLAMKLQKNINDYRVAFNKWNTLPAEVNFWRQQIYARCHFLNSKEYISSLNAASGELGGPLIEATPNLATAAKELPLFDSVEGVTDRMVSANNNPSQERPTLQTTGMTYPEHIGDDVKRG